MENFRELVDTVLNKGINIVPDYQENTLEMYEQCGELLKFYIHEFGDGFVTFSLWLGFGSGIGADLCCKLFDKEQISLREFLPLAQSAMLSYSPLFKILLKAQFLKASFK